MADNNRNRRLFIIGFAVFLAIVVFVTIDMASRTTAPWNKSRQLERALPGSKAVADSLLPDTLFKEDSL